MRSVSFRSFHQKSLNRADAGSVRIGQLTNVPGLADAHGRTAQSHADVTHVRAHRRVLGVNGDSEVLACGPLIPRDDTTAGFAHLMTLGRAASPHVRACPACGVEDVNLPAALEQVDADVEVLHCWAQRSRAERNAWRNLLTPGVNASGLRGPLPGTQFAAEDRAVLAEVLHAALAQAEAAGLTVRELASCTARPHPNVSGCTLARAAARRYARDQHDQA